MYFVGLVVFIAFLFGTALFSGSPIAFIDFPSIILILAFSISMLMASGLFTDFVRGFSIMGKKINTWSLLELKKTEVSLKLMIRLLLLSGFLGSLIGTISLLSNLTEINKIGPSLAVASLTLLYAILLVFIVLPIKAKVAAIIITME